MESLQPDVSAQNEQTDTLYQCPRCGYHTTTKCCLKQHYNRKKVCPPMIQDISIHTLRSQMALTRIDTVKYPFPCDACGRRFTSAQGRCHHKRRACKGPQPTIATLQQEIQSLKHQLAIQSSQQSNTTIHHQNNNNVTINNTIQQVTVHAYDRPYLDHLEPDFLTQCIKRRGKGVCELIEQIHFNAEHPENHSLKIPNRRSNWIETHNGERFELQDKNKVLEELIRQGFDILDEHYNENEANIEFALNYNPTRLEEIRKFLEGCKERDISVIAPLKQDVFLLILNKQYILFQKRPTPTAPPPLPPHPTPLPH